MATQRSGFVLIEVLVAMLIAAIMAAGLAQTLATAQAARRTSELWMRATQLAAEQMERVRTDGCRGAIESLGLHTRSCITEPIVDYPALQRVTVIVEWEDREPHRFQLSSLLPALP